MIPVVIWHSVQGARDGTPVTTATLFTPKTESARTGLVKPIRLTDQISEVIRGKIFSGELKPGDRVVEQKIARELGVGQNAIREVLIELSHLGFVRRVPNIGTFVTKLSRNDAEKISQVRMALEVLVIDLVAERVEAEGLDLAQADELLQKMRKAIGRRDVVSFYENDLRFHRLLWSLTENEYLSQMLEQVVTPLFAFFIMLNTPTLDRAEYFNEAIDHHENVLKALRSGAPRNAHNALCGLLEISIRQQREIISEGGSKIAKKRPTRQKSAPSTS
jgi:DNA-binding GntR family transcriptional regulator